MWLNMLFMLRRHLRTDRTDRKGRVVIMKSDDLRGLDFSEFQKALVDMNKESGKFASALKRKLDVISELEQIKEVFKRFGSKEN